MSLLPWLDVLRRHAKIVLASGSPRRKELLERIGLAFDVIPSGFAEDLDKSQYTPLEYVKENAKIKCSDVCDKVKSDTALLGAAKMLIVIGSDTIVVSPDGSQIIEKPGSREEAVSTMNLLSDQTHTVCTGVCISFISFSGSDAGILQQCSFVEQTRVEFCELSPAVIDSYLATNEWTDKAGGYGVQALGMLLVPRLEGCFFNVMGLPIYRLSHTLAGMLSNSLGHVDLESSPAHKA